MYYFHDDTWHESNYNIITLILQIDFALFFDKAREINCLFPSLHVIFFYSVREQRLIFTRADKFCLKGLFNFKSKIIFKLCLVITDLDQ